MAEVARHKFMRWLLEAQSFERDWRKDNEINFDYYDGEQWSEEERYTLEQRGQGAIVLNVIRPTVDMVLALEVNKRYDYQIVPQEDSDQNISDLLTILLKHVNTQSDADFYKSKSFRDGIIGGRGWMMALPKVNSAKKIEVEMSWMPWNEVYIDPYHRKPDGSDARYIIRNVWMDLDQIKSLWGDKAQDIDTCFNDDYKDVEYEAQSSGSFDSFRIYDKVNRRAMVSYVWYKMPEKITDKTTGISDIINKLHYAVFAGDVILEGSDEDGAANESPIKIDEYPLVPFTAFRSRKGSPLGLVKYIRDLQTQINKLNSKFVWNISNNRLIMEEGASNDPDETHREWNKANGKVILNEGGLGRVHTEKQLQELGFLSSHIALSMQMLQRTSGVNDSMIGMGGVNERSAQQQTMRIESGSAVQTQIMENFYFSSRQLTRITMMLIGKFYTDERIVRITLPDGNSEMIKYNQQMTNPETGEKIKLNNIEDILKYDVSMVPVAPFNVVRERQLALFTEIAKTGILPAPVISDITLELMDIPNKPDLKRRLAAAMKVQTSQQEQAAETDQLAQLSKAIPASPVA